MTTFNSHAAPCSSRRLRAATAPLPLTRRRAGAPLRAAGRRRGAASRSTTTVNVADAQGQRRASGCRCPTSTPTSSARWTTAGAAMRRAARLVVRPRARRAHAVRRVPGRGRRAPTLVLTSRVQTRNRSVDWSRARRAAAEDPALLRANLAPTELIPIDGIVRKTALDATRGATHRRRQGARALRLGRRQRAPRAQGARLRHRRHQGHARDRQPGRQVRRPERAVRRPVPLGRRAGTRRVRPARSRRRPSATANWAATRPT